MNIVTFEPCRWIVQVSVTCPQTGLPLLIARHECRDRHHAATLLSELRELASDLSAFLPGITATGYELADMVPAAPVEPVLPPEPEGGRDAKWWAKAIGLGE